MRKISCPEEAENSESQIRESSRYFLEQSRKQWIGVFEGEIKLGCSQIRGSIMAEFKDF